MVNVSLELEIEGCNAAVLLQADSNIEAVRATVRAHMQGSDEFHLFEKDQDEELSSVEGRNAIAIVAHRCKSVDVTVNFNHESKTEHFPPSMTVFKVLRWATGKRGFDLDDDARAKANLTLPNAEQPLPRDSAIGRYVTPGTCNIEVELTLKDFTNG